MHNVTTKSLCGIYVKYPHLTDNCIEAGNVKPQVGSFVVFQLLSCVCLSATSWTAACQASLYFTVSWSLLKLMSIESMMLSNQLILCCPLLLLPSVFPSIKIGRGEVSNKPQVFRNEDTFSSQHIHTTSLLQLVIYSNGHKSGVRLVIQTQLPTYIFEIYINLSLYCMSSILLGICTNIIICNLGCNSAKQESSPLYR